VSDIDIFHHVGLITRDMARLIARYEQLGFAFTPLSMPRIVLTPGGAPEMLGAGNRHAIFEDNYLEVLGGRRRALGLDHQGAARRFRYRPAAGAL
jgi:hypothetical protein